jgi:GxxExxY protein
LTPKSATFIGRVWYFTTEHAEDTEMRAINALTEQIIGGAIEVHRALGPGLLESTYETCLTQELAGRNLQVERQKRFPVRYKDMLVDCGYRIDLLVEDLVVVELKAVAHIEPIHQAQLLTYLRLSGRPVGLLINFNVKRLTSGLRRLINGTLD